MAKKGTIVLDPGHGGTKKVGDSSPNNATSASGIKEKQITLEVALMVRDALVTKAEADGHELKIVLTRDKDVNVGLVDRALAAKDHDADLLLSIHCNGLDQKTRGVETLVMPTAKGNTNLAADRKFAKRVHDAVFLTIKKHDPKAKDRKVKEQSLAVLRDEFHSAKTRACLVELEFIDVPAVDELLNSGPKAPVVRRELAAAIADALIESL